MKACSVSFHPYSHTSAQVTEAAIAQFMTGADDQWEFYCRAVDYARIVDGIRPEEIRLIAVRPVHRSGPLPVEVFPTDYPRGIFSEVTRSDIVWTLPIANDGRLFTDYVKVSAASGRIVRLPTHVRHLSE